MLARIRELGIEIRRWRARNSQSDPSAAQELRELKKELAATKAALEAAKKNAAPPLE